MSDELKPCPCGQTPPALAITREDEKWPTVAGTCCGTWEIEFRGNYGRDHAELVNLAAEAWNEAPRASAPAQE